MCSRSSSTDWHGQAGPISEPYAGSETMSRGGDQSIVHVTQDSGCHCFLSRHFRLCAQLIEYCTDRNRDRPTNLNNVTSFNVVEM